MNKMENVTIFEHPLIQHKISILRDKRTGTNEFRQLVDEIAMLEGFVALSDLPVEDVEVETPIETLHDTDDCRKKTCRCADSSCRTWYGFRYFSVSSVRKGRTHRYVP